AIRGGSVTCRKTAKRRCGRVAGPEERARPSAASRSHADASLAGCSSGRERVATMVAEAARRMSGTMSRTTRLPPRGRLGAWMRRETSRFGASHSAAYLTTHFRLLLRISRSELRTRYAGSLLGLGWAVLAPLLVLGVYAAVYLAILRVPRAPGLES